MRGFSFARFAVAAVLASATTLLLSRTPASAGGIGYLSRITQGSCTEGSPCSTMTSAIAVAGVGGKVVCLDKGNYGFANITQSVTITCGDGLWENLGGSITVNTPAGSDVTIEGLRVNDISSVGINFTGQGTLHLQRVWIGQGVTPGNHAVRFAPTGPATLLVHDSKFYNIGHATSDISAGIYIKPASGVTASVSIERAQIEANNFGIIADGTAGGSVRGAITDSLVFNNRNNAITVTTNSSSVVLTVDNTVVTGNDFGLVAGGAGGGMLVRRSVVNGNATGLYTVGGAAMYSYRDNSVNGNYRTDGAFTGAVGLQ